MSSPLRVLIVEDSEYDALLIIDELRFGGFEVEFERVETREQMEDALSRKQWDIIICDYRLIDFSGIEALEVARPLCDHCPFINVKTSEQRFQRAMLAETVGVLFFNLGGRIHQANATFERWMGYSSDELRSMTHWETMTAPEFREVSYREAEELATRGKAPPYEKQMIRKDGSRWW